MIENIKESAVALILNGKKYWHYLKVHDLKLEIDGVVVYESKRTDG